MPLDTNQRAISNTNGPSVLHEILGTGQCADVGCRMHTYMTHYLMGFCKSKSLGVI